MHKNEAVDIWIDGRRRVVCVPCGMVFTDVLDAHSHWGDANRQEATA